MTHHEIAETLGAYALNATDPVERQEIEAHLAGCPRCRSEVEAHQEMGALFGATLIETPPGLWDKIAGSIRDSRPSGTLEPPSPHLPSGVVRLSPSRPRRRPVVPVIVAAVAAAAMAFLGVEVAQLHSQVSTLRTALAGSGLASTAAEVAAGPHRTIVLTSAVGAPEAKVIVGSSGDAYWTWSSLGHLPSSRTYQVWGLSRGQVVSLALVGPDPHNYSGFRVETGTTRLMVTAEPAGGSPKPTSAVLAQGAVPA